MTSIKAIIAVVLAAILTASTVSAESGDPRDALIASQERLLVEQRGLIDEQRGLIAKQEALLDAYRCRFQVDLELVDDRCGVSFTDAELGDGALLCPGWIAEQDQANLIVNMWKNVAVLRAEGIAIPPSSTFNTVHSIMEDYRDLIHSLLPSLSSERAVSLLSEAADRIDAFLVLRRGGGEAEAVVTAIDAGIDHFNEATAFFRALCADYA